MSDWIQGKGYRKKVLYKSEDLNSAGSRIQIVEIDKNDKVAPHYHKSQTEVYNVQKGNAILGIEDTDYRAEKGDTLICKPNQIHYVINDSEDVFRLFVVKTNYKKGDTFWDIKNK